MKAKCPRSYCSLTTLNWTILHHNTSQHTFGIGLVFAAVVIASNDLNLNKRTCNAAASFHQMSRTQYLYFTSRTDQLKLKLNDRCGNNVPPGLSVH